MNTPVLLEDNFSITVSGIVPNLQCTRSDFSVAVSGIVLNLQCTRTDFSVAVSGIVPNLQWTRTDYVGFGSCPIARVTV